MAAPPEKTLANLTGNWVMNKTLSDDTDALLALQGVSWWTRKGIAWATITLHCKEYISEGDGLTHIDIEQTGTGGIKGTTEKRTLDWVGREHEDHLFGKLKGKSRWVEIEGNIEDGFLKEGWIDEVKVGPNSEGWIESFVDNEERGWTAQQVWGFAILDGERYHTRRVVVKKGEEVIKVRLVYDWQG